ncbi:MAG TPA: hypothetical protein VGN57_12710 [Pirellulaceae bacterium]|jgi:hypothetical protein|nr:hypothetical protein [Pirellulaceae bacterium]
MSVYKADALSSSGGGTRNKREYTTVWRVYTNDINDQAQTVCDSVYLPAYGAPYSFGYDFYSYSTLTDKSADLEDEESSFKVWLVTCKYSTEEKEKCSEDTIENPLQEPPKVSYGKQNITEAVQKDKNDKPILNKAGEPFEQAVERTLSLRTISITRNESSFDEENAADFENTVNSSSIWGKEKGTVLCESITAEGPNYYGSCLKYWTVTYEFVVKKDGWKRKILNAGFKHFESASSDELVIAKDGDDEVTKPVLLKEDGTRQKEKDEDGVLIPHYLEFEIEEERPFSSLGLPDIRNL